MHGLMFRQFQKYISANFGAKMWNVLLTDVGPGWRLYSTALEYPDRELVELFTLASRRFGKALPEMIEQFGESIAPELLSAYPMLIDPSWKTLEVVENAPKTMQKILRTHNAAADGPNIRVERLGPKEIQLIYGSGRKMCLVAKGILKGLAKHYHEKITISESCCMNGGASQCRILISRN